MTPTIDAARRRLRLDPRDPGFFNDPYRAYGAIHAASPVSSGRITASGALPATPMCRRCCAIAASVAR